MTAIGGRTAKARTARARTQAALADKAGVDTGEIMKMVYNATAFLHTSVMSYDVIRGNVRGADVRTMDFWEAYSFVSHQNLQTALELLLKSLVAIERRKHLRGGRSGHELGWWYDQVSMRSQNKMESVWKVLDTEGKLVAYINSASGNTDSLPEVAGDDNDLKSVRDWFRYMDTDLRMSKKRYSHEDITNWRHHLNTMVRVFQGFSEALKVIVWDKGVEELGLPKWMYKDGQFRGSLNFFRNNMTVDEVDEFYEGYGWKRNSKGLWSKERCDGFTIEAINARHYISALVQGGEYFLVKESADCFVSGRKRETNDAFSEPVLAARLVCR